MPFTVSTSITDVTYASAGPASTSIQSCGKDYPHGHGSCTGADTWYPSWGGAGGDLFSTFTDGEAKGSDGSFAHPLSCGQCQRSTGEPNSTEHPAQLWHNNGSRTDTGHARIVGDSPATLQVLDVGFFSSSALPYQGRYPSASVVFNGTWYVGTYAIAETWGRTTDEHGKPVPLNRQYLCGNWCVLGPFVGFRSASVVNASRGLQWRESRMEMAKDFNLYMAAPQPNNLFQERGPVCHGTIAKVFIGHAK
eukprot:COSAG01_NODE_2056_length_8537_cov_4.215607_6_plen_250_part_00